MLLEQRGSKAVTEGKRNCKQGTNDEHVCTGLYAAMQVGVNFKAGGCVHFHLFTCLDVLHGFVRSFWMDFGITLPTRFCAKASTKKSCTDCEAISPIRFSTVEVDALVGQISPSTLLLWFSKVLTSSGDIL